jgi:hypothetical protein
VDGVGAPMVPGRRRGHDGVREEMVKAMERSTTSVVSWYWGEARLEAARASARCRSGWRRRFPVQNNQEKLSPGAPDHAKEGETREGTWLTGFMPKLKDHRGGCGVLR